MSPDKRRSSRVSPGGDRRTVTATVEWPDGRVQTIVAQSQAQIAAVLLERHERPLRLLSLSNPTSIHADLIGKPSPPYLDTELAAVFTETPEPFRAKRKAKLRAKIKAAQARLGG